MGWIPTVDRLPDDEPLIRQMRNALALPCDRWNATQSRIVREAIDAADAWLERTQPVARTSPWAGPM